MKINKKVIRFIIILFFLISFILPVYTKDNIVLIILSGNSYKVNKAINEINQNPEINDSFNFLYYTDKDIENKNIDQSTINNSKIIIVQNMSNDLEKFVLNSVDFNKNKVFGLCNTQKESKKIIIDNKILQYYNPSTSKNIKNLIFYILNKEYNIDVNYEEPQKVPKIGIFHPKSDRIFSNYAEYLRWYKENNIYKKDGFWVGIPDLSAYAFPGETGNIVTSLIENLEKNGINVLPVYSYPSYLGLKEFFLDSSGKKRIDIICAFSFKFSSFNNKETKDILNKLNIPLFNIIKMPYQTIDEWEKSDQGLGIMSISYAMCTPELNGLIEPTVLGGKNKLDSNNISNDEVYIDQPIIENIKFFIRRVKAWQNLQKKSNKEKKVAIIYWNHTPGKQNVGATYLNVFRSLEEIIKRMKKEGYSIKGKLPTEEEIKKLVLTSGRNIGSWAPGELDELIMTKKIIKLPIKKYLEWYKNIDKSYKDKIEDEWGNANESDIMTKDNNIIIPYIELGNIIILPQPSRGWSDDPVKLYHSTKLWPHHQYTAFYLWLKNGFKADAIVSLGTHGTHEWLPGKQAGLSQHCPPEVLIQYLPNIYPYIMDDIGEGLQAKRRGHGVIIDYLIPAMKKAGVYEEYSELSNLINEYDDALTRSEELARIKLKRITTIIMKLGINKDLLFDEVNDDALEEVEHYLIELQESNVPYGIHTFGVSPEGDALDDFSELIYERDKDLNQNEIKKKLSMCYLEIDRLIDGLNGKYVPPGEGNDPIRNPEAVPTGKNFFGFDPAKVPSKDAYALGKKQAEEMVEKYHKENKKYPDKIGLILWSIELQRNEGTQVGTALHLLGMKPKWDNNNRVIGIEPIPGEILGRPRIDVHLQASGLFRDSYPNIILLLDEAVRQASLLNDVENFISKNSKKIKSYLIKKGYTKNDAEDLSKIRVFSAQPGSYGNTIEDLIPNSGLWEKDKEISDVFINFVSFGYGKNIWGKPLKSIYKKNLEDVKITMHTRSSNLFMNMDTDDVFTCLGGLSLAVKNVSGKYPDVVLSLQKNPDLAHIENIEKTLGKELRARYLNPKWIEGMKKENYAGAREMNRFVEHMWGWQVTTPYAVDKTKWEQVYEVYVEDKYNLDIKNFFDDNNPWALQSIEARMLEAIRKKYWNAEEKIKKQLAVEYALSVIKKGVACCDHTCNNPLLNQMVVNIISIPGLLSPELVNEFETIISKAMGMNIDNAIKKRKEVQKMLQEKPNIIQQEKNQSKSKNQEKENIEGYEIVEKKQEETKVVTSGSAWAVIIIVIIFITLFFTGWFIKNNKQIY
jgi:cobaltochelatase CobN